MSRYNKTLFFLLAFLPFLHLYPYGRYLSWTAETTALLLTALIIIKPVNGKQKNELLTINTTQLTLLGLFTVILLSTIISKPSYLSITVITLFYLFCGFFLSQRINKLSDHKDDLSHAIAFGLLTGAIIQILFTIAQLAGAFDSYANWVISTSRLIPFISPADIPYGLIYQRNLFADYLFISGIACCYLFSEKKIHPSVFIIFIFAICIFTTISMSRSVTAYALTAIALLPLVYYKGKKTKILCLAILLYAITTLLFQFIIPKITFLLIEYLPFLKEGSGLSRLNTGLDESRRIEWQKGWYAFTQNPFFGTGLGTNAAASLQNKSVFQYSNFTDVVTPIFTHSHNLYLQILTETGIFGGLVLLLGSIAIGWDFFRSDFNNRKTFLLISTSTIFIHSQFEFPLWFAFFFILLICFTSIESQPKYTLHNIKDPSKPAAIFIVVACLFGLHSYVQLIKLEDQETSNQSNKSKLEYAIKLSSNILIADQVDNFILRHFTFDKDNLEFKLYLSHKQIKFRPSPNTVFRHAIFLALNHESQEAEKILDQLLTQHPPLVTSYINTFVPIQNKPELEGLKIILIKHQEKLRNQKDQPKKAEQNSHSLYL